MNEIELDKFDVQRYLILEDVLSPEEVAGLNRLVDAQSLPKPGLETSGARFSNYLFEPPYFHQRQSLFTTEE